MPDPSKPIKDNIDYLKLILLKFMQDGDYFKKDSTFKSKMGKIDEFKDLITSNKVDKASFDSILSSILGHEVTKPSIALYLASLLKAKLLQDKDEEDSWTKSGNSNDEFSNIKYDTLREFVIPTYIEEGIKWLITD